MNILKRYRAGEIRPFSALVGTLLVGYGVQLSVGIGNILSPVILLQVYGLAALTALHSIMTKRSIMATWYRVGIPLGVLSSSTCLVLLMIEMTDATGFETAVGNSMSAVAHGALVSFIGFLGAGERHQNCIPTRNRMLDFIFAGLFVCGFMASLQVEINVFDYYPLFLNLTPLLLLVGLYLFYRAFRNAKLQADDILALFTFAMLACVIMGIIGFLHSEGDPKEIGPPMATGLLGIMYCTMGIIICAILFPASDFQKHAVNRTNWHALEIYAMWVLMCFAPISMREVLQIL